MLTKALRDARLPQPTCTKCGIREAQPFHFTCRACTPSAPRCVVCDALGAFYRNSNGNNYCRECWQDSHREQAGG